MSKTITGLIVLTFAAGAFAASFADPPGPGNVDSSVNAGTYTGSIQAITNSDGTMDFEITLVAAAGGYPVGTVIHLDDEEIGPNDAKLLLSQADKQNADGTPDSDNTVTVGTGEAVTGVTTGPTGGDG